MTNPMDRITSYYYFNNGIEDKLPEHMTSIPGALNTLLHFHLAFGGRIVEKTKKKIIATSSNVIGRIDTHIIIGNEEDIKILQHACDLYLRWKADEQSVVADIERMIAPMGVLIDHECYVIITSGLKMNSSRADLCMMIACGITDQRDLARGLEYSNDPTLARDMIALLELWLEDPGMDFRSLINKVG